MNTNVLATVFVSVMLCSVVSAGVSPQADAAETRTDSPSSDGDFGGDVSEFMQRGIASMNASVDSGMWRAAFETAENHTRKQALVDQRTVVLAARFDQLETRIERFTPTPANRSVAQRTRRARLVADRDALQTSVAGAKTTAASEGVNATGLDGLDRRLANLSVAPVSDTARSTIRDGTNATPATNGDATDVAPADRSTTGMAYGGP